MAGSVQKRIEALEAKVNSRGARWILLEVDGKLSDDDPAIEELLAPLFVRRHDVVIAVKKFAVIEGLPRVAATAL